MGIFQAGLLTPNAVGPVLGGVFSYTLGWRAIFWFLTIYSGVFLVFLIFILPETLRSLVGNGSLPARGLAKSPLVAFRQLRQNNQKCSKSESPIVSSSKKNGQLNMLGPLQVLVGGEVTCAIAVFAIYYTTWQMTITSMSTLFKSNYGLSEIQIGLTFLGNGFGCVIGTLVTGKFLDYDYNKIKNRYTGTSELFPLELARLRTLWLWGGLQCASTLVFGWTVDVKFHMSVPIICTFIIGWATTSIQSVVTTFVVDVFPKRGASAAAALNLARCWLGAGGIAALLPIIDAIGVGWTFTLLTGIMLVAMSLIIAQMGYGAAWRRKMELKEKENDL
jgi:predicted MFS family arabinose efflux permease